MKPINEHHLDHIAGGGDPISQPLSMPPGWTPAQPGFPSWLGTVGEYLKYFGLTLAQ